MYITDSFGESEIMKKLRPNCTVIYSNDILQTLEKQKESIMKFKAFIMNPPYGNLHLQILKEMIEMIVENGGEGVSLQPIRWAQDPLWKYKKTTDFAKYGEYIQNHLEDLKTYFAVDAGKVFKTNFSMDIGIYTLSQRPKYKLTKLYEDKLLEKILDKILSGTTIAEKIDVAQRSGLRVKVNNIQDNGFANNGVKKTHIGMYKTLLAENGFVDGKDWTECIQKNRFAKEIGSPIPYSIKFDSVKDATNFIDSTQTIFFQYLLIKMHKDINMPNQWLPFMNDYSEPWTDERFYAYFDITPDEQKVIEKTVKDAKK